MKELSTGKIILFHLYPGVVMTIGYIVLAPVLMKYHYPPQLGLLLCVMLIGLPLLIGHLIFVKQKEKAKSVWRVNQYTNRLPTGKLILYTAGLVVAAFLLWGLTQPLNAIVNRYLFNWLPHWYTLQEFQHYSKEAIMVTLIFNLLFNGILAPIAEEIYFRGYLLPRMKRWGFMAVIANLLLFSLYHFWQPYIYTTLFFSLLPVIYVVWKTKDIRLAILTHCVMNLIGALLLFTMVAGK